MLCAEITMDILGACFEVSNELGPGFLESVYESALPIALQDRGLQAEPQTPFKVRFRGRPVGNFVADLVVQDKVLVELKAVSQLTGGHKAQVINHLNTIGLDVGLLVNFGTRRLQYRRLVREGCNDTEEEIQQPDSHGLD